MTVLRLAVAPQGHSWEKITNNEISNYETNAKDRQIEFFVSLFEIS
jgi:hypothetical protein